MKLNVFVSGKRVAILESQDGFTHSLTYLPDASPADFVSLLMPVGATAWDWPSLHPFFQVSLPEGFLLSVLKEQLGPHLGASPLELLAVVGRNTIGRVQVAAGDDAGIPVSAFEVESLLHGANSQVVFLSLVREYAASGVSGVAPKFLTPETQVLFQKATLATERFIVKGSSAKLPFIALNEHLCMEVSRRTGFATPQTRVSEDGQTIVVERFDLAPDGTRLGFEDVCSLLGLLPEDKYKSTWERVGRLAREWVSEHHLRKAQAQLAVTLLLTYVLGNADCHTKNLALLYRSFEDVQLAPIYDMLSIRVYDDYANNPPGMYIDGRKTWTPGKALWRVLQQQLGIEPAQQRELADAVCEAAIDVMPELRHHAKHTSGFAEVGARMVWEWDEGLKRIRDRLTIAVPSFVDQALSDGIAKPEPAKRFIPGRAGESPLLGQRRKDSRNRRPPSS